VQLPPNDAIRELATVLGEDAAREIVRLFLEDFPVSMDRLGGSGSLDQHRIAHGLKSSALHMGAAALSERMAAIEKRLSLPGERISPEEIAAVRADFEAVAPALRQYAAG
jgi:HPt (histidine-containing phosphotransfer) domain-containing protein